MNATKAQGLKVKAGIKAGGLSKYGGNHSRTAVRVKSGVKAGAAIYCRNHSRAPLACRD